MNIRETPPPVVSIKDGGNILQLNLEKRGSVSSRFNPLTELSLSDWERINADGVRMVQSPDLTIDPITLPTMSPQIHAVFALNALRGGNFALAKERLDDGMEKIEKHALAVAFSFRQLDLVKEPYLWSILCYKLLAGDAFPKNIPKDLQKDFVEGSSTPDVFLCLYLLHPERSLEEIARSMSYGSEGKELVPNALDTQIRILDNEPHQYDPVRDIRGRVNNQERLLKTFVAMRLLMPEKWQEEALSFSERWDTFRQLLHHWKETNWNQYIFIAYLLSVLGADEASIDEGRNNIHLKFAQDNQERRLPVVLEA